MGSGGHGETQVLAQTWDTFSKVRETLELTGMIYKWSKKRVVDKSWPRQGGLGASQRAWSRARRDSRRVAPLPLVVVLQEEVKHGHVSEKGQ